MERLCGLFSIFAALSRSGILLNYFLVYFYVIIYNYYLHTQYIATLKS